MSREVKQRRGYDTSRRRAAAQETRRAIVEAARLLFLERGYTATTMGAIAAAAGVSHETVYAFGPKPALFRHLVEIALSGSDSPVPGIERDYARQVMAETDSRRLFDIYARAMRETQERLAPLFAVLSEGAQTDPDLKALSDELSARRAGHMRLLATHLAEIGGLRQGISVETAADVIWLLNSSEVFLLLVRDRRWAPDLFERWLAESWKLLLSGPAGA